MLAIKSVAQPKRSGALEQAIPVDRAQAYETFESRHGHSACIKALAGPFDLDPNASSNRAPNWGSICETAE